MDALTSTLAQSSQDYDLVAQAIHYLENNFRRQPDLKEVASYIGFSEFHFQRLFTRWVGISPKRFLQFLTKEYALDLLRQSADVIEVTYQSGLSSSGRLHDLLVTCEAVTPGETKSHGMGLSIYYGFHPTPFGECLLAHTDRGICSLAFVEPGDRLGALARLKAGWSQARLVESPGTTGEYVEQIFLPGRKEATLPVLLNGTNFQIKVWEALLRIPMGSVVTYEEIAQLVGKPGAARAVGNAVGSNPLPVLIPCHRVIRKDGGLGGYAFGTTRKMALLGWEMAQREKVAVERI